MSYGLRDAESFRQLALAAKAAGGTKLLRAIQADLRKDVKPLVDEQRSRVRSLTHAPSEWKNDAARSVRVKTATTARRAGVRVSTGGGTVGKEARNMNRGHWRHPGWGHMKSRWYTQRVAPGWFIEPAEHSGPKIRNALQNTLSRYLRHVHAKTNR